MPAFLRDFLPDGVSEVVDLTLDDGDGDAGMAKRGIIDLESLIVNTLLTKQKKEEDELTDVE